MTTPIKKVTKLTTGKQVVAVCSEGVECLGGAGYMEDTGMPRVLRDAQVLPIWEGTTNVLSLDTLRALTGAGVPEALQAELERATSLVRDPQLGPCIEAAQRAFGHARAWLSDTLGDPVALEAGARRYALTVGRSIALALLCAHAQWATDAGRGPRASAAARRFLAAGIDLIAPVDRADSALLA